MKVYEIVHVGIVIMKGFCYYSGTDRVSLLSAFLWFGPKIYFGLEILLIFFLSLLNMDYLSIFICITPVALFGVALKRTKK